MALKAFPGKKKIAKNESNVLRFPKSYSPVKAPDTKLKPKHNPPMGLITSRPVFRLLALDMTLANTGIAVFDVYNQEDLTLYWKPVHIDLLHTEKSQNKQVRRNSDDLGRAKEIAEVIKQTIAKFNCNVMAAEMPTGTQSARASFSFGTVNGILACQTLPLIQVMPMDVKKMVGNGSKVVSKKQIIKWAYEKAPNLQWKFRKKPKDTDGFKEKLALLTDKNEHMADAIAVGEFALSGEEFKAMARISINISNMAA